MKKILLILAGMAVTLGLCACGKPAPEPIPDIEPSVLINEQDIAAIAGYVPVAEPSAREGNVARIYYRSEPRGQFDPVTVEITQFTDTIDYQMLFEQYEKEKAKRPSAELIAGIGQEAYIAYPTIHVYDKGCIIDITAGSGADENQANLLRTLAATAASRLEEIIPN